MERAAWLGIALLFGAGCGAGTGDTGTSGDPADGGPPGPIEVILDGGGEPATPPDGAKACPMGKCNYQTGEGCPVDQPACIRAPDGMNGIPPACNLAGAGTSGAACTQQTDCAAGLLCAQGACHKLCCGGDWTGC